MASLSRATRTPPALRLRPYPRPQGCVVLVQKIDLPRALSSYVGGDLWQRGLIASGGPEFSACVRGLDAAYGGDLEHAGYRWRHSVAENNGEIDRPGSAASTTPSPPIHLVAAARPISSVVVSSPSSFFLNTCPPNSLLNPQSRPNPDHVDSES
jgi:hypothetical protein